MKPLTFWIACATILFALSLVVFHYRVHYKNPIFGAWLVASVSAQLLAAWGLALGRPKWFAPAGQVAGLLTAGLAAAAVLMAARGWDAEANRTIALGLGAMLAFDLLQMGPFHLLKAGTEILAWMRNIAFFGPAVWMLIAFSRLTPDRLTLWAGRIAGVKSQVSEALGFARQLLS